jgi:hypothetical protein
MLPIYAFMVCSQTSLPLASSLNVILQSTHAMVAWGSVVVKDYCATGRMVPGLIPSGVTGFLSNAFPSDGTMTLGSIQPLVKMSTRNIPGGKDGRCVRLTTYHHTVPLSRNLGALTSQNPLGLFRPFMGQLYLYTCSEIDLNFRHYFILYSKKYMM